MCHKLKPVNMDPLIYIAAAALVAIIIVIITLMKKSSTPGDAPAEAVAARPARQVEMAGGMRRRAPRRRMGARADVAEGEESDEEIDELYVDPTGEGKKVGTKKMKKIEEKAEKKATREAAEEERRERKQREALLEEERKKAETRREADEKAMEEQQLREKEEQEKREHEEYLKLKEAFSVEEEGTHEAELNQDSESLLQEFINYIKDMKVVMLEDLAGHFKIKTQDAIDRINTLLEESKLSGVMDDRGKFIYITQDEYESVAKFIKQRGRVSISELAESSNRLINLNPENLDTHKRLVGEIA